MTDPSRPGGHKTFKLATHVLGALVLTSFCCALAGAVAGYITCAAGHAEAVTHFIHTVLGEDRAPDAAPGTTSFFSCACGVLGSAAGNALLGMMWITSALSSRLRRKMIAIFERPSVLLTLLAITGIVCGTLFTVVVALPLRDSGFWDSRSGLLLALALYAGGGGVALGIIVGVLTVAALTVGVLARILAGLLHSAFTSTRPAPANLSVGTEVPWPIRAAAAFMPPEYGRRWRDDFAEALFDYAPDQHPKLLRDFLLHAPATIVWAWTATLQRHVLGAGHSRGRQK